MIDLVPRGDDPAYPTPDTNGYRRVSDFEYVGASERAGAFGLEQAWAALRRSAWVIVLSTAAGLGAAYAWVSRETQLFESTAVIRLLDARGALTGGLGSQTQASGIGAGVDPMLSEIMVLQGREVLGRVVDDRGLRLIDPTGVATPTWIGDVRVTLPDGETRRVALSFGPTTVASGQVTVKYGTPMYLEGVEFVVTGPPPTGATSAALVILPRDAAIDQLARAVRATQRRGTDGIDVTVTTSNPMLARDIANAVVLAYQDENALSGQERATRRREFLETQLAEQDLELASAQAELAAFRTGRQMYSSQERLQAEQATLLDLETRHRELESNRRLYQSLRTSLDEPGSWTGDYGVLVTTPGISENPVVEQYYSQLLAYQVARDTMTTGIRARTAEHPDVQQLDSLLAQTERRLAEALESQVRSLDLRIGELALLRESSANQLTDPLMAEAEEARLTRRVETFQQLADQLRSEVQRASVDEAVETGQVEIVQLAAAALPMDPRRAQKLLIGAAAGLLLAIGFSLMREAADRTLVRPEDIERSLHLTNLAVIPRIQSLGRVRRQARKALMSGRNGDRSQRLVDSTGVGSRARGEVSRLERVGVPLIADPEGVEAYRTLRANLIFAPSARSIRTLVVTSAAAGEGKTMTVANLGLAFAMQGARVIMVDGDLRRPDLAKLVDIPKTPGLSEVLLGEASVQEAVRWVGAAGLDLLPAGYLPRNPSELLGGRRMEQLIEELKERYDLVLIDGPPLLATSDAAVLGAMSDGVLLVVRAGYTDKRATVQVLDQLRRVGANVVGTVLNDPNAKVPDRGGYYGYRYRYEAKPDQRPGSAAPSKRRQPVAP